MYTQKKMHGGFIGLLLIVAVAIMFFFYTKPAQTEMTKITTDIAGISQEIDNLKSTRAGSSTVQLSEVQTRELAESIPESFEQDFIVTELNRIAKATDVSFNVLSFSLQRNALIPTVNISAGFQGLANNVTRFLKMLESSRRKFVVKDAGISRMQTESGLNLLNLNVTMQAYYRKDE